MKLVEIYVLNILVIFNLIIVGFKNGLSNDLKLACIYVYIYIVNYENRFNL